MLLTTAHRILTTADPVQKAAMTLAASLDMSLGTPPASLPDTPARPEHPRLIPPQDVPKRKLGQGVAGRVAMLHALAHIELNAIDLAWDIILRFHNEDLPDAFFSDWATVAKDEAKHFTLLNNRLHELGSYYGALPAHNGLWEAAVKTKDSLAARLAVVPMVLEARGLDVTPSLIHRLHTIGDAPSAAILQTIYEEEIPHVATGVQWFTYVAVRQGITDTTAYFHDLVRTYYYATLKAPFNDDARAEADMPAAYYHGLVA